MARLDLAPAVRHYLEAHAIDVDLALEFGVRSGMNDSILYPYKPPRGEPYVRTRDLESGITKQPKTRSWCSGGPLGGRSPAPRCFSPRASRMRSRRVSALNGDPYAVCAIPGTAIPVERVTAELGTAGCVYVCLDGDEAGRKAGNRIARALRRYTTLKVVQLGDGEDCIPALPRRRSPGGGSADALSNAPLAPEVRSSPKRRLSEEGGRPDPGPARAASTPRPSTSPSCSTGSSVRRELRCVAGDREGRALRARGATCSRSG